MFQPPPHLPQNSRLMADLGSEIIIFKGSTPEECETFVSTVRRQALDRDKHRDNEWMANFAASCLAGDAFYWYEDLQEDVQNDWRQLRPALVAKFGRKARPPTPPPRAVATPTLASPVTIPTPAAAPPAANPLPTVRKGRLKVLGLDGSFRGYLLKKVDEEGVYGELSRDRDQALLVSVTSSSAEDTFEILLKGNDALAICWLGLHGTDWMIGSNYQAYFCSWSSVTSGVPCATEKKVWKLSKDGELGAEYPTPGDGTVILRPYVDKRLGELTWVVVSNSTMGSYRAVKIVFEDGM